MHKEESRTDFGAIKIHKNVIASIASLAASQIEGVKRVGFGNRSSILDFIHRKVLRAIKVSIDKNEDVKLDIPLVIKYDFNIPEVSARVQENVRLALEKMTNLAIKDIDISVQSIEKGE